MLDTIRYQEKEIKKFSAILAVLMSNEQLDIIVNSSEWDEEKRDWKVPAFTYKEKKVNLPKLSKEMTRDFVDSEKEKKELYFRDSKRDADRKVSSEQGFKLNNIVRNAREAHEVSTANSSKTTNVAIRTQLTPLKN